MKYIKKTSRGLEVAQVTMKSPAGKVVNITGAIHLAHEDFFADIREWLLGLVGMYDKPAIHLEGIKKPSVEMMNNPEAQKYLEWSKSTSLSMLKVSEITGLAYQTQALKDVYEAVPSEDMTLDQLWEKSYKGKEHKLRTTDASEHEGLGPIYVWAIKNVTLLHRFAPMISRIASEATDSDNVIVGERNKIVVDSILSEPDRAHVVFWGAAHVVGIVKSLKAEGYSVESTRWHLAIPKGFKSKSGFSFSAQPVTA